MFPFQSNNLNHTNEHLPTQISENRSPASDKFSPNPDTFSSSTSTELPSEISFSGSETNQTNSIPVRRSNRSHISPSLLTYKTTLAAFPKPIFHM